MDSWCLMSCSSISLRHPPCKTNWSKLKGIIIFATTTQGKWDCYWINWSYICCSYFFCDGIPNFPAKKIMLVKVYSNSSLHRLCQVYHDINIWRTWPCEWYIFIFTITVWKVSSLEPCPFPKTIKLYGGSTLTVYIKDHWSRPPFSYETIPECSKHLVRRFFVKFPKPLAEGFGWSIRDSMDQNSDF